MKKLLLSALILSPIALSAQINSNAKPQWHPAATVIPEEDKPETGQIILAGFAKIIGNFFNLVKDPRNAANVGYNVAGIVHTIVDTAVEAMRKGELSLNPSEEEIAAFSRRVAESVSGEVSRSLIIRSSEIQD
jgi:hypothetical protein